MWGIAVILICSYNLLSVGDVIRSKTVRKVKSTSASDMVTVTKKVLTLSLKAVEGCFVHRVDHEVGVRW